MLSTAIVAHDPLGEFLDGTILHGAGQVTRARDSGALVLPYDVDRYQFGGYVRHGWGEGWAAEAGVPRMCPMLLRVVPERPWVYWTAWVVTKGPNASGTIRLVADTNGPTVQAGNLSGDEAVTLGGSLLPPAGFGIGGRRRVSVREEGFLALGLYLIGADVSVQVSAATQSRIDVAYP